MARRTLGILFGGRSAEHEVSVQSAASIWRAVDRSKYEVVPIAISKAGKWTAGMSPLAVLEVGAVVPEPEQAQDPACALAGVDIAFPVLHGPYGEDGTIQGMLEILDIPYVGAGVLASSLCLDKAMAKLVFAQCGFPQGPFLTFHRNYCRQQPAAVLRAVEDQLGFPCFVKPANMGSSVGISKVHIPDRLPQALELAADYDSKIVIEAFIDGREIECSVLGNEQPMASVPGEILPDAEFYDYQAKYVSDSQVLIPAPLTPQQVANVQQLAIDVFTAAGCSGLARVDFFLRNSDGQLLLNEVNTMPGFTRISAYPKLWEASGLAYSQLVDELVVLALERYAERR
ncbi:MAG TPA: D-alanine--D-alanine ligase A [Firmicutes bacterium]|nr:D-alanine--D-alanine ligase A [Bacillota bacterium]